MTTIAEPNLCQLQAVQHSFVKKYEKTTTPNIFFKNYEKSTKAGGKGRNKTAQSWDFFAQKICDILIFATKFAQF